MRRSIWLWSELFVFVAVPLLMYEGVLPNWPIPFLLLGMIWALFILGRDPSFDRRRLVRREGLGAGFRSRLLVDLALLLLLGLAVWFAQPGMLFSLVKRSPELWLLVVVFYPLLSVYPQELLYRTYFFHRFEPLFGSGAGVIAASAALFGFVHIIFWQLDLHRPRRRWRRLVRCDLQENAISTGRLLGTCAVRRLYFHYRDWPLFLPSPSLEFGNAT